MEEDWYLSHYTVSIQSCSCLRLLCAFWAMFLSFIVLCMISSTKLIFFLAIHRSNIQIKSHGQKVLQRLNAGEDVFAELEWPVATVKIPLSLRSSPAGASALISASSSDEEDGASLASDGEPSYEESSDTTEDKGYEPRHFESEEALVVQALLKLADAVSLTQHLAETAAAKGPVSSCFGVVL